ncbi:MAG: histidinol dehydrogenase, partial [Rhodanobacter sp.]
MKQFDWNQLDASGRVAALGRAPQTCSQELRGGVAQIIADVRARGDAALRELSARYDGCELGAIEVDAGEFAAAQAALAPDLKDAIREAAARIEFYHRATALRAQAVDTAPGVRVERILRPIDRVGLYVPAGTAPLPSTALMLGIPARIASCPQVVLCSPARADGSCDPAVLFAAQLTGVHRVFRVGGAQAIA